MMEFGLFSVLAGLVVLVSFIWLLVVSFRESLVWGFLVFLFSPISAIAFSIYHWDEAKKPFLIYLAANIVFLAIFFNTFHQIGGMEMISTTQETAAQLEKGEITEAEAARRVAEQAESSIKRMEEAGVIGTDERKLLEEKVQELKLDDSDAKASTATKAETPAPVAVVPAEQAKPEASTDKLTPESKPAPAEAAVSTDKTQKAEHTGQEKLEYGPEWSLEAALEKKREKYRQQQLDLPTPKIEGHYVPLAISRAEEYIGQQVKVVKADTTHEGLLKAVNENFITLDMQAPGGQVAFEIKRHQIHSMFYLTIPAATPSVGNKKAGQ